MQRVYQRVLDHGYLGRERAAAELGMEEQEAAEAIARLRGLGLLRGSPAAPDRLIAVSPETAVAARVGRQEIELRERELQLAELRSTIEAYGSVYQRDLRRRAQSAGVEVLDGLSLIGSVLDEEADRCRTEVLTLQPGGPRIARALTDARARDTAILARGARMLTLYQHSARFNQMNRDYVKMVTGLGAEVRTLNTLPPRLIVFDRKVAFLPDRDDTSMAVVIRNSSVASYLAQSFDHFWAEAVPFAEVGRSTREMDASADIDSQIVRMLVSGDKDEMIAKQVALSLRTCRRRIAVIMERLDARSRFQAGYETRRREAAAEAGR
ncbi:helix-turn-helix transcriptional regulator [Kitasatospora kazusensis]|uniref:Helix-turn-helix transcriptional regulator n=1 Tax=Kitasatospora kazusensis TaxID=407974 RepID=A0ABN2Z2T2_9ACTN